MMVKMKPALWPQITVPVMHAMHRHGWYTELTNLRICGVGKLAVGKLWIHRLLSYIIVIIVSQILSYIICAILIIGKLQSMNHLLSYILSDHCYYCWSNRIMVLINHPSSTTHKPSPNSITNLNYTYWFTMSWCIKHPCLWVATPFVLHWLEII